MGLRERLGKEWLFCDGGTGSILQELGLKGGELPELWNLNRPEDIKNLNKGYFDAGSNIVNTNTFGANRFKFDNVTLGYTFPKLFKSAKLDRAMGLNIYATVQNVATVTNYDGLDPEVFSGIDNNLYPRPRTYILGVKFNF